MPTVSIIMPAYNAKRFIDKAIRSVQYQTFSDWELIVIDDCSIDGTPLILKEIVRLDTRVKLIVLKKNVGAAIARNTGIKYAGGRYIAFLDSDDTWKPQKLDSQLKFMREKKASFVFSAYMKVNEKGENVGVIGVPEKVNYKQLLKCCVIGCLTAMYDTKRFGKAEMPIINSREDFGLWLKLLKATDYAYGQNEVLAKYTVREGSLSFSKNISASYQWRFYRDIERLSLLRSTYYFSHYAVQGMLRAKFPGLARSLGVLE